MRGFRRGDTIIEVLLSVTIFSMVAVGAIALMNRGMSVAQRSLETTQVRSGMKMQAEAIRFVYEEAARGSSSEVWDRLADQTRDRASDFGADGNSCPRIPNGAFAVDSRRVSDRNAFIITSVEEAGEGDMPFAHVDTSSDSRRARGLWVEAIQKSNNDFIDFHIRACWDAPGQAVPITLGTIVRLYAP